MRCPECGNENPEGARFCMKCGARFSQICLKCGAGNPAEAIYCQQCGASLVPGETDESGRRWVYYLARFFGVVGLLAVMGVAVWFVGLRLGVWDGNGATPAAVQPTPEPTLSPESAGAYTAPPGESTLDPGVPTVTLPPLPTQAETPVPSKPTGQADAPPGLILHAVLAADGGSLEPRLVVRNIEGKEVGQILLSGVPSHRLPETLRSNLILTAENRWLLVNTSSFTAELLAISDPRAHYLIPNLRFVSSGSGRYIILNSQSGDSAFLVSLETGRVSDLLAIDADIGHVWHGQFSPDEEYLAFSADRGVWLLATDHPEQARRLVDGHYGAFSFSGDGREIAYIQRSSDGNYGAVVEKVDGSGSEVVTTGAWLENAAFVPGQNKLVLAREKALTLLSLDTGEEQELLEISPRSFTRFAPNGHRLLAGAADERGWHIIDLEQGTSRTLDELSGFSAEFRDPSHRWLFFRDSSATFAAGVRVAALDLETGAVVLVRGLDSGVTFGPIATTSADAGRVLIEGRLGSEEGGLEYWLIMAEEGEAHPVAEGSLSSPGLSADGRWFLYSQWHEDRQSAEIILLEVDSGKTRSLGEGLAPVWVRP